MAQHRNIGWLFSEMNYEREDGDKSFKDCLDHFEEVNAAISCGQPFTVPGTWSQGLRQLYQDTDFHFVKGRIFKKSDAIADAYDGRAGRDIVDADKDELCAFCETLKDRHDVQTFIREHEELFDDPDEGEDALNYADHGMDFDRLTSDGDESGDEFDDAELDPSMFDFVSLNSHMCGLGYRPPRDRYEFRNTRENNNATIKALERKTYFADLKAELADITDEDMLNSFLERIRDDYYGDKAIRMQWNKDAFDIDRSLYQNSLRRRGCDEETIRRLLAWAFDNKKMEMPNMFTIKNGKRVKVELTNKQRNRIKRSRDSLWYRARSKAYEDLTLTYAQWSDIYGIAKTKRTEIRTLDNKISSKSFSYFCMLRNYIEKINGPAHICALCDILDKHHTHLIPNHRRELWNKMNQKAQECGLSSARNVALCRKQTQSAESVDILQVLARNSRQRNPFKMW